MRDPIVVKTTRSKAKSAILRKLGDVDQETRDHVERWAERIKVKRKQKYFEDSHLHVAFIPTD